MRLRLRVGRVYGARSANNPGRGEPAVQGWWAVVRAHSTPRLHHFSFAARALATSKIAVTVNGSSGGCDQIVDQLGQPSLMATETFDDGLQ
jgi:sulfite reductase alpha subunit-like flavoprotein